MQIFADNTHHEAERNDAYYLFFVRLCVKTLSYPVATLSTLIAQQAL